MRLGVRGTVLAEDAWQIVGMGIWAGQIPPPQQWIDELREDQELAALEGLI